MTTSTNFLLPSGVSVADNLSDMSHSQLMTDTVGENSDVNFADHSELSDEEAELMMGQKRASAGFVELDNTTTHQHHHHQHRGRKSSKSSSTVTNGGSSAGGSSSLVSVAQPPHSGEQVLRDSVAVRKIYTEWANHYLEKAKATRFVDDLQKDLCDGLLLAEVIAAVTGEKVPGLRAANKSREVAIENVNKCLTHIRRIGVNVDEFQAKDIVDGSLKTILGLFFNLSRYKQQLKTQQSGNTSSSANRQKSNSNNVIPSTTSTTTTTAKNSGIPSPAGRKAPHHVSAAASSTSSRSRTEYTPLSECGFTGSPGYLQQQQHQQSTSSSVPPSRTLSPTSSLSSTGIPLPRRAPSSSIERPASSVSSAAGSLTASSVASSANCPPSAVASPSLRKPTHNSRISSSSAGKSASTKEDKMMDKWKVFRDKSASPAATTKTAPPAAPQQMQSQVMPQPPAPQYVKSHIHAPSRRLQSPSVHTKLSTPPPGSSNQPLESVPGFMMPPAHTLFSSNGIAPPSTVIPPLPSSLSSSASAPTNTVSSTPTSKSAIEVNSSDAGSRIPGFRKSHHHHRNDRQRAKELYAAMKSREVVGATPTQPPQSESCNTNTSTSSTAASLPQPKPPQAEDSLTASLNHQARLKQLQLQYQWSAQQRQLARHNNVPRGPPHSVTQPWSGGVNIPTSTVITSTMGYLSDHEVLGSHPVFSMANTTTSVEHPVDNVECSFMSTTTTSSMSGYSSSDDAVSGAGGSGYVSEGALSEYSRRIQQHHLQQERFRGGLMLPVQETSEAPGGDPLMNVAPNNSTKLRDFSHLRAPIPGEAAPMVHSDVDGDYGSIYSTSSRSTTGSSLPAPASGPLSGFLSNSDAYNSYLKQLRRGSQQDRHCFSDADPTANSNPSSVPDFQAIPSTSLAAPPRKSSNGGGTCFTHPNSILAAAAAAASASRLKRNGSFSSDRDKIYGIALPPSFSSSTNTTLIKSNAGPAPASLMMPSEWPSEPIPSSSSLLFAAAGKPQPSVPPTVGNLIHFGPGFRAPRLNTPTSLYSSIASSSPFSNSTSTTATMPHNKNSIYRAGGGLKYSSDSEYAPGGGSSTYSTGHRISPAPSLNSVKLPYTLTSHSQPSTNSALRLLGDAKDDDDPDVKGSSLSLASAGSCRSANEERQSIEIRKLKRELEMAQQKVTTLSSRLSSNLQSHVVFAFEQSLNSMTTRLQALSSSAERKDSELLELKMTIDSLREQSRQQLSQQGGYPGISTSGEASSSFTAPLPSLPGMPPARTGPLPPTPSTSGSTTESPAHHTDMIPSVPATPVRKSSFSVRHGSFSKILKPTRSSSQQEDMVSMASVSLDHPGTKGTDLMGGPKPQLVISGSLTSLESVLSGNPRGSGSGKKSSKKGWLRTSLGKAFRRKSSKGGGVMSDVEGDTSLNPHRLYAESPNTMKESHSTGMIHNASLTSDELLMMRKELEEKDMKLTDVRLEALSSAHRLEQLKELVTRMRHEMSTLKADNERLQRLMKNGGFGEGNELLMTSVSSAPTTFLGGKEEHQSHTNGGQEDSGGVAKSRSTDRVGEVNHVLPSSVSSDDMRLFKGCLPLCSEAERLALDRLVCSSLVRVDGQHKQQQQQQMVLLPVAVYLGSVSDGDMQHGTRCTSASVGAVGSGGPSGGPSLASVTVDLRSTDIGYLALSPEHTWSELESQLAALLCEYGRVVDPVASLGLTEDSLASFRLVDVFRRRDASITPDEGVVHDDADSIEDGSPWAVVQQAISAVGGEKKNPSNQHSCVISPQKVWVSLLGSAATTGSPNGCCLDALAFESLVPKPVLQRYVSLLLEHRRIIFSGSPGTGKTYLAQKLAEFLVARCGRRLAGAVVTFNVDHKSVKELRHYLTQMAEQIERAATANSMAGNGTGATAAGLSPTTPPELPVVIILDNLHHAGSLYDILQCLVAMRLQKCPYIIGTMNQSSCNTMDLKLHHNFRWVLCSNHMEPVKGFLGRYLRRKMCHMQVECHGCSPEMVRIVQWMPMVWQKLNHFLETHNSVDVTLGPRLFLSCPMSVEGSQVWFTDLWNYSLVPYIMEAVREGLQQFGRRCTWEDPVEWIVRTWPWGVQSGLSGEQAHAGFSLDRNLLSTKDMRTQLIPLRPEDVGYDHQAPLVGPTMPPPMPSTPDSGTSRLLSSYPPPPPSLLPVQNHPPPPPHLLSNLGSPTPMGPSTSSTGQEDPLMTMLLRLQEVAKYGTGFYSESSGSHSDSNSSSSVDNNSQHTGNNSPARQALSRTA